MRILLRHLRQAARLPDAPGPSDGLLLERFLEGRDEEAFAALVRLHGPMVFGVCQEQEKLAKALLDAGRIPPWDLLDARAARLEAEIALERFQNPDRRGPAPR
jgi:hypothetical protein